MRGLAALALAALLASPALAQDEEAYIDDRSTPEAVINSLYNAINRAEYLRAYSYFGADNAPADFETFSKGYEDTDNVDVLLGKSTSEGAAGSTYYSVPVAIDAVGKDGTHKQFAGCYTLRLANPQIQATPPFVPLHIEKGDLKPANGELEAILPASCE